MDKKGLEMNFAWIFGIIVGAVILVLALYATTGLVKTEDKISETKTATQLGILINPLETGLEEASYAKITLPVETQIYNKCRDVGNFGKQILSVNERKGLGDTTSRGEEISFFNKYIFSKSIEEGKKLHLIIKPLEMPYKVADMVFLSADDYCFVNPFSEIEDELGDLNPEHIFQVDSLSDCPSGSRSVCFGNEDCEIMVNPISKIVTKNGETVYYEDSLIYGAIFADKEIYECQVKRLMKRNAELAYLYLEKSRFLSGKGCSSNLELDLEEFIGLLNFGEEEDSYKLSQISSSSGALKNKNDLLTCELF